MGVLVVGNEEYFIEQQRTEKDVVRFTLSLTDEQEERIKQFYKQLVRRYPISFQFLLKCLIKIKYYEYSD